VLASQHDRSSLPPSHHDGQQRGSLKQIKPKLNLDQISFNPSLIRTLRYWPSTDTGYLNEQMTSLSGKVTDVSGGGEYSTQSWCAVVDHVKVECWGSNGYGQLVS